MFKSQNFLLMVFSFSCILSSCSKDEPYDGNYFVGKWNYESQAYKCWEHEVDDYRNLCDKGQFFSGVVEFQADGFYVDSDGNDVLSWAYNDKSNIFMIYGTGERGNSLNPQRRQITDKERDWWRAVSFPGGQDLVLIKEYTYTRQ